ncbi:MAG: hypothetical protein K2K82_05060 [Muribaculaceae bacterium]|nr:hypothetical protein [Muribaculaceae bacterium]
MDAKNPLLEKLQSCPTTTEDIRKYFSETANLLMNNYVISKRGIEYEIVEIEFYLFTHDHPDVITYPRDCKAGQWFFHPSGVDLTFATTDMQFGGILIRGLRETKGKRKQVFGPLKCVDILWDKLNAFEAVAAEIPTIIPANGNIESYEPISLPRWIPVRNDKEKALAKIAEWEKRIKDEDFIEFNSNTNKDKIFALVFESEYRFIKNKKETINFDDDNWKRYNAKIRTT